MCLNYHNAIDSYESVNHIVGGSADGTAIFGTTPAPYFHRVGPLVGAVVYDFFIRDVLRARGVAEEPVETGAETVEDSRFDKEQRTVQPTQRSTT